MLARNEQLNLQPNLNKGAGVGSLTIFVTDRKYQISFKQAILNFGTKCASKWVFPVGNRKSEYHHRILHIGISLGTKP